MSGPSDPPLAPRATSPAEAFSLYRSLAIVGIYLSGLLAAGLVVGMLVGAAFALNLSRNVKEPAPPGFYPPLYLGLLFAVAWWGGGGAVASAVLWGRGRFRDGGDTGFGFARPKRWWLALGGAAALVLAAAYLFLAPRFVPEVRDDAFGFFTTIRRGSFPVRAGFLAFGILVAPPLEEFLFRGVLLAGLRTRLAVPSAAAITTAVFVALHLSEAMTYWPALLAITGIGVLVVVLRVGSHSLYPGIFAHAVYNAAVISSIFEA